MVQRTRDLGMRPYVSTNGTHLGSKISPTLDADFASRPSASTA
jgi:hypothetical protein